MPAAQTHRKMPRIQYRGHGLGIAMLRGFQITIGAGHGAGVVQRRSIQHRQVGKHRAQRCRTFGSAHAAMVAAHAFIAGKPQHRHPGRSFGNQLLHRLMPAPGGSVLGEVNAAAPACNRCVHGNPNVWMRALYRPTVRGLQ